MTSEEAINLLMSAYGNEVIKGGRGCGKTAFRTALLMGANAIKTLTELQNVELGHWEVYEFESIIPAEWDDEGNLVLHKYIGHKCNICGNKIGCKKTNFCSECGTKMKMD